MFYHIFQSWVAFKCCSSFQLHDVFFSSDNLVPPLDPRCHLHILCMNVATFPWLTDIFGLGGNTSKNKLKYTKLSVLMTYIKCPCISLAHAQWQVCKRLELWGTSTLYISVFFVFEKHCCIYSKLERNCTRCENLIIRGSAENTNTKILTNIKTTNCFKTSPDDKSYIFLPAHANCTSVGTVWKFGLCISWGTRKNTRLIAIFPFCIKVFIHTIHW